MDYKQIDEHSAVIRTLKENDIKIKPKGYSMYPLFVPEGIMRLLPILNLISSKKVMLFYTEDMIIQEFLYYTEYAE